MKEQLDSMDRGAFWRLGKASDFTHPLTFFRSTPTPFDVKMSTSDGGDDWKRKYLGLKRKYTGLYDVRYVNPITLQLARFSLC